VTGSLLKVGIFEFLFKSSTAQSVGMNSNAILGIGQYAVYTYLAGVENHLCSVILKNEEDQKLNFYEHGQAGIYLPSDLECFKSLK
jgi:hypothetical protein